VKIWVKPQARQDPGGVAVVVLMLALWVGSVALTVSPQLHGLLHDDAHSATHSCLVTHLQQYTVLAGTGGITVSNPSTDCSGIAAFADFPLLSRIDYRLSPSRAPPSAPFATTVEG
jgi:hypothetical protein